MDGEEIFLKTATVEVTRTNSDTLLILVSNDGQDNATSPVRFKVSAFAYVRNIQI